MSPDKLKKKKKIEKTKNRGMQQSKEWGGN